MANCSSSRSDLVFRQRIEFLASILICLPLSACVYAEWNNPTPRTRSSPREQLPQPTESGVPLQFGLSTLNETTQVSLNSSTREVSIQGLDSSVPQVFSLTQGSDPIDFTSCTGSAAAQVLENKVVFRPYALFKDGSTGLEEFRCSSTDGAQYFFNVSLSSMLRTVLSVQDSAITTYSGNVTYTSSVIRFSRNHQFALTLASGGRLTSPFSQVIRTNLINHTFDLVSITPSGEWGNGDSVPYGVSDDGRFVVLSTYAANLVGSVPLHPQLIVKDMVTGQITTLSQDTLGNLSTSDGYEVSMSEDGRSIVFSCVCFSGHGPSPQIYQKKGSDPLIQVSTLTNGTSLSDASAPRITANGRYLIFQSTTDAIAGDPSGVIQLYRKNLVDGSILTVSKNSSEQLADLDTFSGEISDDGNLAFFITQASNLVVAPLSSHQILRKNLTTGDIQVVSAHNITAQSEFSDLVNGPYSISSDGSILATLLSPHTGSVPWVPTFTSPSGLEAIFKNLVNDTHQILSSLNGVGDVSLPDTFSNLFLSSDGTQYAFTSQTEDLVANSSGEQLFLRNIGSSSARILPQGNNLLPLDDNNYVFHTPKLIRNSVTSDLEIIFSTFAGAFINGLSSEAKATTQIFAKNLRTGAVTLLSTSDGSTNGASLKNCDSPDVSSDGLKVVFRCHGSANLEPVNSALQQIYFLDRTTGIIRLASTRDGSSTQGVTQASIRAPKISNDGNYLLFSTTDGGMIPSDPFANGPRQLFRKNLNDEALILVSSDDGTGAKRGNSHCDSDAADLSTDGAVVVFSNFSTANLAGSGDSLFIQGSNKYQIFLLDLSGARSLQRISVTGAGIVGNETSTFASISGDGMVLSFVSRATNLTGGLVGSNEVLRYNRSDPIGTFTLLSGDAAGSPLISSNNCWGLSPILNADGSVVLFQCPDTLGRASATPNKTQVFMWEQGQTLKILSSLDGVLTGAQEANSNLESFLEHGSSRWVVYQSESPVLHHLPFSFKGGASGQRLILQAIE